MRSAPSIPQAVLDALKRVESTHIDRIGWRANTEHGHLVVAFRNGVVGQYRNVPRRMYVALLMASSKGRFLSKHIKSDPEAFPWERLTVVRSSAEEQQHD